MDLYIVARIASKLLAKLKDAHHRLQRLDEARFFYESPDAIWKDLGIQGLLHRKFDILLDKYMVKKDLPWWRRILTSQGSFRQEALSSMILTVFNQNISDVHALAGLMAFMLATDDALYHIKGGNAKLMSTAWNQAKEARAKKCPGKEGLLSHVEKEVSTVVGSIHGFDLYNENGDDIGEFDLVILATPISESKIDFLIKSHMDETAVLQQMPLGGLIENSDETGAAGYISPDHEGHSPLPRQLPAVVTRRYIQSVTTIVRNATLQADYWFGQSKVENRTGPWLPRQIYMTAAGKFKEHNVTGIFRIPPSDGTAEDDGAIYKICSSQHLSLDILRKFFGSSVEIEVEHEWHIAPDYQGRGTSTDFMIYDGATGFQGHTKAGALYYPHALDLAFSTLESQAMGARAVAKLIAKRLEWIETFQSFSVGEEL